MDSLTQAMGNTSLDGSGRELEELLFEPRAENGIRDTVLDNIPRYLFRIASPSSAGSTDEKWVKSESVLENNYSATKDIFCNLDDEKRKDVAEILKAHLRWWKLYGLEDNFMSWTSSLLFAIQYIYYRCKSSRYGDESTIENINLYVIDTTKFRRGTFMRDLDLMDIFCEYDEDLRKLRFMRNGPKYYFGEYLSQGALKIENKCQVIPARVLFQNDRLRRLQPRFAEPPSTKENNPELANAVVRLRDEIWSQNTPQQLTMRKVKYRLQYLGEIIQHIEYEWRFPIAIYFAALFGSDLSTIGKKKCRENPFFAFFHDLQGSKEYNSANFNVVATDRTPELKQVQKLLQEISKYLLLKNAQVHVGEVEAIMADLHLKTLFPDDGTGFFPDEPNKILAETGNSVLSQLVVVLNLCERVTSDFSERSRSDDTTRHLVLPS